MIREWVGGHDDHAQIARVAAWVIDEISAAETELERLQLEEEARAGVLQITGGIKAAFSLQNLNSPAQNFVPQLEGAVGTLAILVSAARLIPPPRPQSVAALLAEIEALIALFEESGLAPDVVQTAVRHLRTLGALLNNIEAFGVDSAMSAYADMMVRVKRAMETGDPRGAKTKKSLWDRLRRIRGGLKDINEAYESSSSLLEHAGEVVDLLGLD
jgi:hypothetical protein